MADSNKPSLLEELKCLLQKDVRFIAEGQLLKNIIVEHALKLDKDLIRLLLSKKRIKERFFVEVDGTLVFDKDKFISFIDNKQFLPDSYTAFKNKIGLTLDGKDDYLKERKDVVLVWPYKDCVLEGGQTKEDQKRDEIFWNETLAPDEIDRLFEPKVLTNFKRFDKEGENKVSEIKDTDNLLIKGNNLLALHSLKKKFAGEVKLIYIDPPYNTGNDSFKYNDSFNHSTWLAFMKNRLETAYTLLRNDGSIFISIDNKELGYLQVLMDEIFGKENNKNLITVKRSSVSGAKVINPGVVNLSEYLVVYSKNTESWKPNKIFKKRKRDERYNTFIANVDENPSKWKYCSVLEAFADEQGVRKSQLRKHLNDSYDMELEKFYLRNSDRIIRFAAVDEKSVGEKVVEIKRKSEKDDSKTYVLKREEHLDYYFYKGQALLFFHNRLINIDGEKVFAELISDIWNDVLPNDLHNEGGVTLKKGKKPEKMLQRIIQLGSEEGDLIVDFFVGSGTSCAVAHKMGRQYIGIEQLDYGNNDSVVRLRNVVSNKDKSGITKAVNWKGGGNFVYCELMEWNEAYIEQIGKARTKADLAQIWEVIKEKAHISYKIELKVFDKNAGEFEQISFEDQRKFLLELLDKNQLYVNYCEIDDTDYKVSEEDKKLNKLFYGGGNNG